MSRKLRLQHEAMSMAGPAYDGDYFAWTLAQASAIRAGRTGDLDLANLAEEVRDLGESERREIESRLSVLLAHLLKWRYLPEKRSASWSATIFEQRMRIARRLRRSPSLGAYPSEVLDEEYAIARRKASGETALSLGLFPIACPFAIGDVLDEEFYPDAED